jgi:hypothetical protein
MRKVVDTNFLQSEQLREYLLAIREKRTAERHARHNFRQLLKPELR